MEIETFVAGQMSEAAFLAACALHHAAFPKPGRTLAEVLARKRPVWMPPPPESVATSGAGLSLPGLEMVPGPLVSSTPPVRWAVRDEAGRWLGNAGAITRVIGTANGPRTVVGLLDVATRPETRGQGLGVKLVRAAWSAVDAGQYPACLLKTSGARTFYEKIGARVIDNPLVNTTADGEPDRQPFGDSFAMIYPAEADWPDGEIDLQGPAF